MAIASTRTIIPLDRAALHLGIDPYHFNGCYTTTRTIRPSCDDVWFRYDYQQNGKVSRESLATALSFAEKKTYEELRFYPLPQWVVDESVDLPQHWDVLRYNFYNSRGQHKSIRTDWGYVTEVGTLRKVPVECDAAVSFEDLDLDLFNETMQVTVATDVTDEEELRVYYPGKNGRDEWEIRPLSDITIAGGSAIIQWPKELGVLETLINRVADESFESIVVDGDDDANFLQTVDVYRVYTDTASQMTLQAESCSCSSTPCEFCTETACTTIRDAKEGIVAYQRSTYTDGAWVSACQQYFSTQALISYRAGWQDKNLRWPTKQMDNLWERLIVFYAVSQLDKKLCGCSNTQNIWEYQTEDLSLVTDVKSHANPWTLYDNPFGSTRAALNLNKQVQKNKLVRSFVR